ncbi:MAG: hypothetical protein AAF789_13235, partial [Bacteroidota bacterium]
MKRFTLLTLALIASSIVLAQMGRKKDSKGGKTKGGTIVTLSMVSETLASFEGNPEFDFLGDSITYTQIGKEKYDNIFSESAIMYATVVQMDGALKKMEAGQLGPKDPFSIAAKAYAATSLPGFITRAEELLSSATELQPKTDFPGIKEKAKIPRA